MKFFKRRNKKAEKDIFKKGEFNMSEIDVYRNTEFIVALKYKSHSVDTVYPACASCYGISCEKNKEYEQRLGYIGRRVKSNHTSVLEHSNIVVQVYIPLTENKYDLFSIAEHDSYFINENLVDIDTTTQDIMSLVSEVRDVCRYLSIVTKTITYKDTPVMKMTIGGPIRGFRYIFENIKNRSNRLFLSIFRVLKLVVEKEFFLDFINDNIMDNYNTISIDKKLEKYAPQTLIGYREGELIDIINMDNLDTISSVTGLDYEDCLDFVSITVNFKNMSRIITQQVTRHRNGITQESQRYVNYSGSSVNSPAKFKDKYDENTKYKTPIGELTFDELGEAMVKVYESLVDQKVDKEDARGYLPSNVQCRNLYITFTLRTLMCFLNLRTDKHAQAEVRQYAEELAEIVNDTYVKDFPCDDVKKLITFFTLPQYIRSDIDIFDDIDEEV